MSKRVFFACWNLFFAVFVVVFHMTDQIDTLRMLSILGFMVAAIAFIMEMIIEDAQKQRQLEILNETSEDHL